MIARLDEAERTTALDRLPGWAAQTEPDGIARSFKFRDFSEAFAFMTRVAMIAERAGHHPVWSNSYNRVAILLTTHDAGGLSQRDVAMAAAIDALGAKS